MKKILAMALLVLVLSCKKKNDSCIEKKCSDFKTQTEAKKVYDSDPDCYKDLDADHDGQPCESLPL